MESVLPSPTQATSLGDKPLSDKHCVFQCGDVMYALPATAVREVSMMPIVVPVPLSHPALYGIGNVRSEFLPVIDLAPLVGNQANLSPSAGQLLIVDSPLGSWAIAIDRVIAIDGIETHVDAEQRNENTTSILLGTASYQRQVISVLDVNGLQRVSQQTLESQWSPSPAGINQTSKSIESTASKWSTQ